MTNLEFQSICGRLLIDPSIAIENDAVRRALKAKDDEAVKDILETEF